MYIDAWGMDKETGRDRGTGGGGEQKAEEHERGEVVGGATGGGQHLILVGIEARNQGQGTKPSLGRGCLRMMMMMRIPHSPKDEDKHLHGDAEVGDPNKEVCHLHGCQWCHGCVMEAKAV